MMETEQQCRLLKTKHHWKEMIIENVKALLMSFLILSTIHLSKLFLDILIHLKKEDGMNQDILILKDN